MGNSKSKSIENVINKLPNPEIYVTKRKMMLKKREEENIRYTLKDIKRNLDAGFSIFSITDPKIIRYKDWTEPVVNYIEENLPLKGYVVDILDKSDNKFQIKITIAEYLPIYNKVSSG